MSRRNNEQKKSPFFRPSEGRSTDTTGGVQNDEVKEAKSTLMGCSANMINAIVGSGIVGIPYAVSQAGWAAGIGLIVLCAILTRQSLRILIATAKHCHTGSYETLAEAGFGSAGFVFVAVNMLVMAYGAMLSYLMIVKDTASSLLGIETIELQRATLVLISTIIILPLSCQRDMANLAFTSRISVIFDTIIVAFVAYNAPITFEDVPVKLHEEKAMNPSTLFVGLGVLSFAFVCQHSAFLIAGSLSRPTHDRWTTVTTVSLIICGTLALVCGISGYLAYGQDIQGNVLMNLPNTFTANAARAMLGSTMLCVYPLESFVARHVIVALFFQGRRAHEGNEDSALLNRADRRIGLTTALYLSAVIPACLFKNLGNVLAVTGAIGGSCLSYLGPGAVYLAVHGERFKELVRESKMLGAWYINSVFSDTDIVKTTMQHGNEGAPNETTSLLDVQRIETEDVDMIDSPNDDENSSFLMVAMQTCLSYVLLMPVWCAIASFGQSSLSAHMHLQALKSPHPLRIGDFEYRRTDETTTVSSRNMKRSGSLQLKPSLNRDGLSTSNISINQQIGQQILQKQMRKQADDEVVIEPDIQIHPEWPHFLEAIFFCVFGVVALVAGLWSCLSELL
ncbi:solute carrier family 38 (sodium-coupled neutral amino acid transporter), member 11 [Fistulifera solaris]|uniref:Solute carrier family 38 (Sodium-coupled neutral amino acid transporter), member 11 n=1 Tax=Fistulifera solaris TaxID=1519565 RepID=A0A1Z5JDC6_FISSO|nr:solute carrier family 38 (sodium-coupled neutral amino acid transporter), member 11 [Fistulifera solaris]|eukprot:GAX12004.1 solute carrier family 38 (sodium-coupled neutral amino acid transporter), member 11 [Fistulifera solaris]